MERIVFLDRNSVNAVFRPLNVPHEWIEYPATNPYQVVERLECATIAITNKVPLRSADLTRLPELRMISVAATGVDCIDVDYCRERGIAVSNVRNYAQSSVAEHVFMLILVLRRNLVAYREALQRGQWQKSPTFCLLDYPMHELYGSTLGIIGYGALGKAVERLGQGFGMRVLLAEHKGASKTRRGRVSFAELLQSSDVISLHAPLNSETRGMINEAEFKMMRPTALLINCARGGLVDEPALIAALKTSSIAGAGIDVLALEPPLDSNPLLDLDLPHLIITPHIAWASAEAMQTVADQVVANIEAYIGGISQNLVA